MATVTKTAKTESASRARPVVIIGAGSSSEKIIREVIDNPALHYNIVGLCDDDNYKIIMSNKCTL